MSWLSGACLLGRYLVKNGLSLRVQLKFSEGSFMADSMRTNFSAQLLFGFTAGFLATLIFHQLAVALLWSIGVAPSGPFSMAATQPFGVPAVLSLAFWGGAWGILFALIHGGFPGSGGYWVAAFLFGAILPSLVALMVVLPLKGQPMGGGWNPPLLLTAFLINGVWGIGTGLILKALTSWFSGSRNAIGMIL
jgi:hypothetical protein